MVACLLGLLLALQTLGWVHSVAHAATGRSVRASVEAQESQAASALGSLFGLHDAGSLDCQLYEHLLHSDLAATPVPELASPVLGDSLCMAPSAAPAEPAACRFCARDPPLSV